MILLGTGTSYGIPVVGCGCGVCSSTDPHDNRNRCSAYVSDRKGEFFAVVDTGPEFRIQAIKYGVRKVDAVFITHSHADHLNGLDDLRIFSHTKFVDPSKSPDKIHETKGDGLPIYTNARTIGDIKNRFDYIFMPVKEGGGKPKLSLVDCETLAEGETLSVGTVSAMHVPIMHGSYKAAGWVFGETGGDGRFHKIAYLTDTNFIPDKSVDLVLGFGGGDSVLDHLVIDGLRKEIHSTHFSFEQALGAAERFSARNTWLTHIDHNMGHEAICSYVMELVDKKFPVLREISQKGGTVSPAYDGLELLAQ